MSEPTWSAIRLPDGRACGVPERGAILAVGQTLCGLALHAGMLEVENERIRSAAKALLSEGIECLGRPERCSEADPCGLCLVQSALGGDR